MRYPIVVDWPRSHVDVARPRLSGDSQSKDRTKAWRDDRRRA